MGLEILTSEMIRQLLTNRERDCLPIFQAKIELLNREGKPMPYVESEDLKDSKFGNDFIHKLSGPTIYNLLRCVLAECEPIIAELQRSHRTLCAIYAEITLRSQDKSNKFKFNKSATDVNCELK